MLSTVSSSSSVIPIEESYRQFLASIDQTLLDDITRQRLQRIIVLDDELDQLQQMKIELNKTSERHSRRRTSNKEKDSLVKENENLQEELIEYTRNLKRSILQTYSAHVRSL